MMIATLKKAMEDVLYFFGCLMLVILVGLVAGIQYVVVVSLCFGAIALMLGPWIVWDGVVWFMLILPFWGACAAGIYELVRLMKYQRASGEDLIFMAVSAIVKFVNRSWDLIRGNNNQTEEEEVC